MEAMSAIFDMDGVITDTAQIHYKAWKQIFDKFLEDKSKKLQRIYQPFTIDDYIQYVDGLSRVDGIKYFLQSRNIFASGNVLTDEEKHIITNIAEIKNKLFLELIATEGVSVFESTINLIKELKKNNIKTAVISSSFNCQYILSQANVINLFDAIVDGKIVQQNNLKGKPDPAIFLEAAKRIDATPSQTFVVEDAISGIIASKAGQFGLVIGIDRQKKWASQFRQEGADIVVNDLSELELSQIRKKLSTVISPEPINDSNEIIHLIKNKKIILFCDYDGTLTPIVKKPELAILSEKMKNLLNQLKNYCRIVIISGRKLSDLENMVAIDGLYYAGNHGFEIAGSDQFSATFKVGNEFLEDIEQAYQKLLISLKPFEKSIIENKKFSLSVHYRLVEDNYIDKIEEIIDETISLFPRLVKHHGKKVFELRPNLDWNKGKAVNFILQQFEYNNEDCTSIYIGDDVTDEDAFAVLKNNGVGILVSDQKKSTQAKYRLHDTESVFKFLNGILKNLNSSNENINDSSLLTYKNFNLENEKLREALCTLGNGYFATRGAHEESKADKIHYPGTYFAGCYNRLKSVISGKNIYNEDLVNMPNWLPITFKIIDRKAGEHNNNIRWFALENVDILNYEQTLNLQAGVLTRKIRIKDHEDRITRLEFVRFVSMANPHLAVQKFILQPENWSGKVLIKSGLDGSVINSGVERYRDLSSKHLEKVKLKSYKDGGISLVMRTNQSHIEVAYTAFHRLYSDANHLSSGEFIEKEHESIYCYFDCDAKENHSLILEKLVVVATNKDNACRDCLSNTKNILSFIKNDNYDCLFEAHNLIWKKLWRRCEINVNSEKNDQFILKLHIFHLLQTVSQNSVDLDIGVPARGLHGESYRGHIFWDELFIMPFYIFYFPEMARSLLLYRYRRLNMARFLAKKSGYKGAMYPWQSGSDGDEVTQRVHLNPRSNKWMPDFSHFQRHVNAAIVYNIWQYFLVTNDVNFMSEYGAEMILEIASFWSSIAIFNTALDRYEITHVVGPDEYHEKYPNSKEPGVNNNAYTNVMAVWSIERALEILTLLSPMRVQELKEQLHIDESELSRWKDITVKMKIPFHDDNIISQFEGYEALPEFDWEFHKEKYGNIERLDRILKAENDSPDNYKVSKQADVLMLFYLFSKEELSTLFSKLGYTLNEEVIIKNIFYYLKRTSHGSTLSKVVLASLAKYINSEIALEFYQDVLNSDIMDTQGGTTSEGVHLGAMASCINIILKCFAGMAIKDGYLSFEPKLPPHIRKLQFNLQFHQQWLNVSIENEDIKVDLLSESKNKLPILINGKLQNLHAPH